MLNFLRELRRNNLQSSKYLKYAIGEIVLVVIGILIALAINTWNENRKAREFETKMLIEIRSALTQDLTFFEDHLIGYRNQTIKEAAEFFNNYYLTKEIDSDSIDYYFYDLNFGIQVTFNRGPYDALKSTGLDKISNDQLRSKMIEVYDFQYPRWEGLIMTSQKDNQSSMEEIIKTLIEYNGYEIVNGKINHLRPGLMDKNLIDSPSFIRLVGLSEYHSLTQEERLIRVTPYMKELIDLINKEIKN